MLVTICHIDSWLRDLIYTDQFDRPTKRRIRELEEENRRLWLQAQANRSPATQMVQPATVSQLDEERPGEVQASVCPHEYGMPVVGSNPQTTTENSIAGTYTPTVAEQVASDQAVAETPENQTTRYHGPTSASFDLSSSRNNNARESRRTFVLPDYEQYAASLLCAESARQSKQ